AQPAQGVQVGPPGPRVLTRHDAPANVSTKVNDRLPERNLPVDPAIFLVRPKPVHPEQHPKPSAVDRIHTQLLGDSLNRGERRHAYAAAHTSIDANQAR